MKSIEKAVFDKPLDGLQLVRESNASAANPTPALLGAGLIATWLSLAYLSYSHANFSYEKQDYDTRDFLRDVTITDYQLGKQTVHNVYDLTKEIVEPINPF